MQNGLEAAVEEKRRLLSKLGDTDIAHFIVNRYFIGLLNH